jgi:dephospho-CoA kinase
MTLKIGLTGGIGSGKTTVSHVFHKLGIPVFNSDLHAKELLEDEETKRTIVKNFGEDILDIKQSINKHKLSKIIFSDKNKLKFINQLIHPLVTKEFKKWVLLQNTAYVIKEYALLFQSDSNRKLDKIILVQSPLDLRIQRVKKRDKKSIKEIKEVIKNQIKIKDILSKVDFIIHNNESRLLFSQIKSIHNQLSKNSSI